MVGHRIKAIIVGVGPRLLGVPGGGRVSVQINTLPLGGMGVAAPGGGHHWLRLRHWIFAAGGLAANLTLYFILRLIHGGRLDLGDEHGFIAVAAAANWAVVVLNLIPFRTADGTQSLERSRVDRDGTTTR